MFVKQFVDEDLGNSSYLIASEATGLAAVIDPQRDVDRYLQVAQGLGLRLTYAFDTHLHNDFISGARELLSQRGIRIGASAEAHLEFDHQPLAAGATLSLGDVTIGVLATPGHTPEHISFTVTPIGQLTPAAIFTGGALIVGGAARTDLLGPDLTEHLSRQLYHTLHDQLLRLPDEVMVYPTHGAGSFCSAPVSAERSTTIGRERRWNALLQAASEEEFVAQAVRNLPDYPTYFRYMRAINQRGPKVLMGLPKLAALSPDQVQQHLAHGVAVIDARAAYEFLAGHISESYGIPLGAPLITWAGWVVPFGTPIILVADDPIEREEAVRQLIRIGYDDLRGYLDGGLAAWVAAELPTQRVPIMPAEELRSQLDRGTAPIILDVRHDDEWRAGHLPRAIHLDAGRLPLSPPAVSRDERIIVHCGHADRSTVGLSVLERWGYRDLMLLDGGYSGWQTAGYPIVRADE
ncbi:MAG: MBL fold metallo-hydrolase [Chloroflexi bacterium]|nr:MBL fold metallo-hydrolase [Chloroflexota bacterium]